MQHHQAHRAASSAASHRAFAPTAASSHRASSLPSPAATARVRRGIAIRRVRKVGALRYATCTSTRALASSPSIATRRRVHHRPCRRRLSRHTTAPTSTIARSCCHRVSVGPTWSFSHTPPHLHSAPALPTGPPSALMHRTSDLCRPRRRHGLRIASKSWQWRARAGRRWRRASTLLSTAPLSAPMAVMIRSVSRAVARMATCRCACQPARWCARSACTMLATLVR